MDQAKITQGLDWLDKEMKKDQREIEIRKERMIEEIKSIDRSKMLPTGQKKLTLAQKIQRALGYGR
jgi:hypothetical protein